MQFFKQEPNIDFMGGRKIAIAISILMVLFSIGALAMKGLSFGLDFTGGTLIEVGYSKTVDLPPIRAALEKAGFRDAVVQHFGTAKDVLVRIAPQEGRDANALGDRVLKVLNGISGDEARMRRQEFVGPQVGNELRDDGGLAMLIALGCIMLYVMARFEYRFALGSIIALLHDVTITLGCFAFFQWDFDLTVLAAVLAVIGYSLNDTIVVFDRIRENFRKLRKVSPVEVVNRSLNQTLSRTIMTSFTTMLVVVAMFLFGGELIHSFALALMIGIFVGTYSSIYVASTLALAMNITSSSLVPVKKEGEGAEQHMLP
ncbi:Protein translocase subunit SecF [hydrothermal vent metagenome]|uniref:Protein translocase subunit SecF n=1 Tax=hydrothermal vent metagenome TaxID=652676 RepID=A0A3B1B5W6_9ZZZZ